MKEEAKTAAVLAGSLVLSVACFQLVSGDLLVQGVLLAAVGVGAAALADRPALAWRGMRGSLGWPAYVLAVGLACGLASVAGMGRDGSASVPQVLEVVLSCLFTGVFEEGVFRVAALAALVPAFGGGRRGLLKAALVSSLLFGALHVPIADAVAAGSAVAWAQTVLKPLQATLFGLFMAGLFVRTRSLWAIAGLHGLFNVFYAGPLMLAGAAQATYVTGDLRDLALLAASTALLVPPALAAWSEAKERGGGTPGSPSGPT
ncbi:CPBP family intramembrane glutamic endopeptidase [Arabiibacter massiliensis]|uniref:CPBP family intramembrane glutamic endopeptidase n=1 Tax=Arabiibacter massiliensis TaxID=1870985 RepID=UPI0009BC1C76|nr:CPBP family intramembrane glutamic endopeptidase [Arabiibacter massiliensis]